MAALLSRVRPAVIVCVLITCSATNVHAVWGPYGTMLTQPYTYHGTGGAHVYPRPDASILVGYRPWAGTYPDYTSDWALVSADGDLLGSGRAGG